MGAQHALTLRPMSRVARARALTSRPMGATALRLPERVSAQLANVFPSATPRIFVHEGARQSLERRLRAAAPGPVNLSITDNRHSIISHTWEGGILRARIHHMFLDAPPSVINALVRYVTLSDRDASLRIGHYIEANGARLARRSRTIQLVSAGKHHDLLSIFQDLNERYFQGSINAVITWGKRSARVAGPRTSIKLGSYNANERLIRIHPALDRSWVPRYFVASVVFHEMLHHAIPVRRIDGRRDLHPLEFRTREQEYRRYQRSLEWEKNHIARLLRA